MAKEETGLHLSHLDGWRALAVLIVIFGHFWGDAHIWEGLSSSGVDLFFVLSGRLMAEILFVRRSPLSRFFVRRISRVFPALIAFVFFTTLVFHNIPLLAQGILAVAVALTMTLNYAMVYGHQIALLDHLWSLCVEEHAYIILAGLALCSRRRTINDSVIIGLLGIAALINGIIRTDVLGYTFLVTRWRTDVSVAGIFLGSALWLRLRSAPTRSWLPLVWFGAAVMLRLQHGGLLSFGLSTVALALAIVTIDYAPSSILRALSVKPLRQIGLWSFSLYLWQQPFYKLLKFDHWPISLALAGTFACALASFYLVEQPARRAINRIYDAYADRRMARRFAS